VQKYRAMPKDPIVQAALAYGNAVERASARALERIWTQMKGK
jgi:hypothetical protein